MSDRVDAAVPPVEPAAFDAAPDLVPRESGSAKIGDGDEATLPARDRGDEVVGGHNFHLVGRPSTTGQLRAVEAHNFHVAWKGGTSGKLGRV